MKVAAHPLLVAVALGLLGPAALAAETSEDEGEVAPRRDPANTESLREALDDANAPAWSRLTLVDVGGDDHTSEGWNR